MKNLQTKKKRYYWVDNTKFAACILVVIGHLYMSLVTADICSDTKLFNFIIQSMYAFHVPLFFVCSGFLYQKSDRVHSVKSWGKNVLDKLLCLGVPYFTFTGITLLMKTIFSNDVNNQAGNTVDTFFVHPVAPYWYLYALFFIFVFIPNVKSKKQGTILLTVAAAAKIFSVVSIQLNISVPYILYSMCNRSIWFVIGMFLALDIVNLKAKISKILMVVCFAAAFVLCIMFYTTAISNNILQNIIGLLFVISIIIMAANFTCAPLNKLSSKFSPYFMPIYVTHTIFAAGVRIVLIKFGITSSIIHIILGLTASLVLPIIVYLIAEHFRPLLFFFYPKKALKGKSTNGHNS